MSKFNLKTYQKINGDEHITKRLSEQHDEAPQVVTEKQLEKDRVKEKDVILEKQLEKTRTGSADRIIEKNLNDSKGLFAPLRNSDTYTGNINKIEEKRLSGDKSEDEKYEAASETSKDTRWWEYLKESSSAIKTVKTSARPPSLDQWNEEKAWQTLEEETGGTEPEEGLAPDKDPTNEFIGESKNEETEAEEDKLDEINSSIEVIRHKETQSPIPAIYYLLRFNPADFNGNIEEAKLAAFQKVLDLNPNLAGKISVDDFNVPKRTEGQLSIRLIGPEYFESAKEEMFSDLSVEQVDVGGTPVTVGRLNIGEQARAMESGDLIRAVVEYIVSQNDEIADVDTLEKSLNLSALDKGEITFAIGSTPDPDSDIGLEGQTEEELVDVDEGDTVVEDEADESIVGEDFPVTETENQIGEEIAPAEEVPAKTPEEIALEEIKKKDPSLASVFPIIVKESEIKKK